MALLQFVAEKTEYALSKGLKVILCVGETLEQRESNQTFDVISKQVKPVASKVKDWSNIVVAYEPVWAIGTGKVASKEQASTCAVHHHLVSTLPHPTPPRSTPPTPPHPNLHPLQNQSKDTYRHGRGLVTSTFVFLVTKLYVYVHSTWFALCRPKRCTSS